MSTTTTADPQGTGTGTGTGTGQPTAGQTDPQADGQSAASGPQEGADDHGQGDAGDAASGPQEASREAARYRRQARAAESERDAALALAERLQLSAVHALAGKLAEPGDLLTVGGHKLADLLTEDGQPDAERVTAAVDQLLASRPGLAAVAPPSWPDMGQGQRGAAGPAHDWLSAFKPR